MSRLSLPRLSLSRLSLRGGYLLRSARPNVDCPAALARCAARQGRDRATSARSAACCPSCARTAAASRSPALFLVLAAVSTLVFPVALKSLIDQGFVAADPGTRVMALREHFFALFGVGVALGVFSAARFYMVSWLGERVTADLRNAVYAHVVRAEPRVLRDHADRRGAVAPDHRHDAGADRRRLEPVDGPAQHGDGHRRDGDADRHQPVVMTQVLGILVLVVLPSLYFGRRVRRLSRASQDRVADSSAIAAEVLNAIPVVQSYTQEAREAERFAASTEQRLRHRGAAARGCARCWSPSSSARPSARCSGASTRARRRCCAATSAPATSARPSST